MVDLLQMGRDHGQSALITAVEKTLRMGSSDAAAVKSLLTTSTLPGALLIAPLPVSVLRALSKYERPLPDVTSYDQLLGATHLSPGAG